MNCFNKVIHFIFIPCYVVQIINSTSTIWKKLLNHVHLENWCFKIRGQGIKDNVYTCYLLLPTYEYLTLKLLVSLFDAVQVVTSDSCFFQVFQPYQRPRRDANHFLTANEPWLGKRRIS